MQKDTLNKIERLDDQQDKLIASLKLDYQAMLTYINKISLPSKDKAIAVSR